VNWTRRQFLVTSSAVVTGALTRLPLLAQQPAAGQQPPPAPTVFTPLRGNVGIFTGAGGTIGWLVSPGGVVVVDTGMGAGATACLTGIHERSSSRPIDAVFNTHHHGDHTGGNGVFKPAARRIVAHVKVPALQKATARPGTEATLVLADTTFTDKWTLKLRDEKVQAIYCGPAHTGGDSVIVFERANIVHLGDLVFNRRLPVTDRPGGCSLRGWIATLDRLAKAHDAETLYVFGHAKPGFDVTGKRADLLYQRDFLAALVEYVRDVFTKGRMRDEIVKAAPTLKGFEAHGPLSERVLTAAFDELTEYKQRIF
jgi:glyoxylase-like metal-dependent hydrolase (beta-lactamase superfamily II)